MAYEKRISDWSSDVCSSDLIVRLVADDLCVFGGVQVEHERVFVVVVIVVDALGNFGGGGAGDQIWHFQTSGDRMSVVLGKGVSVSVDLGGRRIIKKKQ